MVTDLGCGPPPKFPTRAVAGAWLALRAEAGALQVRCTASYADPLQIRAQHLEQRFSIKRDMLSRSPTSHSATCRSSGAR